MERHRTDVVSLTFGVLFVVTGLVVLANGAVLRTLWLRDAWPLLLVLLGLWILVATVLGRQRSASSRSGQPREEVGRPDDRRGPDEADEPEPAADRGGSHPAGPSGGGGPRDRDVGED